jgi:hypothetical protein
MSMSKSDMKRAKEEGLGKGAACRGPRWAWVPCREGGCRRVARTLSHFVQELSVRQSMAELVHKTEGNLGEQAPNTARMYKCQGKPQRLREAEQADG